MEMPEGWNELRTIYSSPANFGGSKRIFKALELMKEMAEALTIYNNTSNPKDLIVAALNGHSIMKKFKDWK